MILKILEKFILINLSACTLKIFFSTHFLKQKQTFLSIRFINEYIFFKKFNQLKILPSSSCIYILASIKYNKMHTVLYTVST